MRLGNLSEPGSDPDLSVERLSHHENPFQTVSSTVLGAGVMGAALERQSPDRVAASPDRPLSGMLHRPAGPCPLENPVRAHGPGLGNPRDWQTLDPSAHPGCGHHLWDRQRSLLVPWEVLEVDLCLDEAGRYHPRFGIRNPARVLLATLRAGFELVSLHILVVTGLVLHSVGHPG